MFFEKLFRPGRVFFKRFAAADGVQVFFYEQRFLVFEFHRQARGQYRETHHFDQADIFFFNVVHFGVRVENAHREFLRGAVIAQHQVQLEGFAAPPGDGGNGVVRRIPGFGQVSALRVALGVHFLKDEFT